jgi:hypothetical protein
MKKNPIWAITAATLVLVTAHTAPLNAADNRPWRWWLAKGLCNEEIVLPPGVFEVTFDSDPGFPWKCRIESEARQGDKRVGTMVSREIACSSDEFKTKAVVSAGYFIRPDGSEHEQQGGMRLEMQRRHGWTSCGIMLGRRRSP